MSSNGGQYGWSSPNRNKEVYGIIEKLSMDMTENIERNLNTELKRKGARNDLPREFVDSEVIASNVPTSQQQ